MKKIFLGVVLLVSIFTIPKASAFVYPNGTLLKADNDVKIYAVWNGKQRWIRSGDVFNSYNFKWADIKTISSLALKNLPVNNLVRVEGDVKVYALNDLGYKRHIQNPAIFNSYGLDWNDVATITQKELDNYPETNLIRMDGDPKVYYLENDVKKWITTAEVFYINNLNWDAIQVVNKEDLDTYTDGVNIEGVVTSTQTPITTPVITAPPTQNTETPIQRYINTEGGAVYDTVLKKFISPAPSTQTPTPTSFQTATTTQSSTIVVGSINLSASSSIIPADGKSTSVITATVRDVNNNVASGQTVYFSYGNVTVAAVTNANGIANITYTADTNIGIITVTASIGNVKNTAQITKVTPSTLESLIITTGDDGSVVQNRTTGETSLVLGVFRLTASGGEDMNITRIVITDALSGNTVGAAGSFTNLRLFKADGTQVGQTMYSMEAKTASEAIATFNPISNLIVVKNQTETLTLKGDINSYPNAVPGSYHTFKINSGSDITVIGTTLNQLITVTGVPISGNLQRIHKANLSISAYGSGNTIRSINSSMGSYGFINNSKGNYSITINDIHFGLDIWFTGTQTITKYITLRRGWDGPVIAKKGFNISKGTNSIIITDWQANTNDSNEITFTPFTIDAMGSMNIYAFIDTSDMVSGSSITSSIKDITLSSANDGFITTPLPIIGGGLSY